MTIELKRPPAHEQTRARYPDEEGYVERGGVHVFYEVYGSGEPTVLLLPTWSIVHSRHWKMQIPYLARHCRVLTFDGRGNGRSDRPPDPDAYREEEFAADALAVMDATGTERAVLVSLSRGAERSLHLAAGHPERVDKLVFISPALPLPPAAPRRKAETEFSEPREEYAGWDTWNRHYRHLAACDLAVVQGGLTTSMELTANRRPFLYFPLRHHFEQNFHVRHRLERYGAGRRMDFERETPETIAAAIAETIGQTVDYRPVESDGAARAAALIAPLLEEGKPRLRRSSSAAI